MRDPQEQIEASLEYIQDMYGPDKRAHADGSLRIRGRNILDLRLDSGQTVREYLVGLLWGTVYQPGGSALIAPVRASMISCGMVDQEDQARAERLVGEALEVLAAESFRPIGTKTDTERHLARLQRRNSPGKKH